MSPLLDSRLRGSDDPSRIYRDHSRSTSQSHSRESRNPGGCACRRFWIPAYAGVTVYAAFTAIIHDLHLKVIPAKAGI